jgi:hypothetical protein
MKRYFAIVSLVFWPLASAADDWSLRTGEIPLSYEDLQQLTAGQTLTFYDNGQSRFSVGGSYSYTYPDNGGSAFGLFELRKNGTVCISFRNGASRCDLYVRRRELLMLITEQGDRFPIRVEVGLQP